MAEYFTMKQCAWLLIEAQRKMNKPITFDSSYARIRLRCNDGTIPKTHVAGHVLVHKDDINEYLGGLS